MDKNGIIERCRTYVCMRSKVLICHKHASGDTFSTCDQFDRSYQLDGAPPRGIHLLEHNAEGVFILGGTNDIPFPALF